MLHPLGVCGDEDGGGLPSKDEPDLRGLAACRNQDSRMAQTLMEQALLSQRARRRAEEIVRSAARGAPRPSRWDPPGCQVQAQDPAQLSRKRADSVEIEELSDFHIPKARPNRSETEKVEDAVADLRGLVSRSFTQQAQQLDRIAETLREMSRRQPPSEESCSHYLARLDGAMNSSDALFSRSGATEPEAPAFKPRVAFLAKAPMEPAPQATMQDTSTSDFHPGNSKDMKVGSKESNAASEGGALEPKTPPALLYSKQVKFAAAAKPGPGTGARTTQGIPTGTTPAEGNYHITAMMRDFQGALNGRASIQVKAPIRKQFTDESERDLWKRLSDTVQGARFDFFFGALIFLNAIFVGAQANQIAQDPLGDENTTFRAFSSAFCWVFFAELLLRIAVHRKRFIVGTEWKWNVFDSIVVATALIEEILTIAGTSSGLSTNSSVSIFRLTRIVKLARVLRIVRVIAFFRELRIILQSIASCVFTLGWTLLLVTMILFIFGVYLTLAVAQFVGDGGDASDLGDKFSTVPLAMLTLLGVITGDDWAPIVYNLRKMSIVSAVVFILYICFMTFAMLNILTGFFVEQALKAAEYDIEHVISEELGERERIVTNLRSVFHQADTEGTGTISWNQLMEHFRNSVVQAYFKNLQIELYDLRTFFELCSGDLEDATVSIDQFVRGCLRLRGPAKNADVVVLRHQVEMLSQQCADSFSWLVQQAGGHTAVEHGHELSFMEDVETPRSQDEG